MWCVLCLQNKSITCFMRTQFPLYFRQLVKSNTSHTRVITCSVGVLIGTNVESLKLEGECTMPAGSSSSFCSTSVYEPLFAQVVLQGAKTANPTKYNVNIDVLKYVQKKGLSYCSFSYRNFVSSLEDTQIMSTRSNKTTPSISLCVLLFNILLAWITLFMIVTLVPMLCDGKKKNYCFVVVTKILHIRRKGRRIDRQLPVSFSFPKTSFHFVKDVVLKNVAM